MASDRACWVPEERIRFCSDLICDDNNAIVQITPTEQIMHVFVQFLLSVCERASSDKLCTELASE